MMTFCEWLVEGVKVFIPMEIRKKRGYEKMLKETGHGRKVGIAVSTTIFMLSFSGPLLGRVANTHTPLTSHFIPPLSGLSEKS